MPQIIQNRYVCPFFLCKVGSEWTIVAKMLFDDSPNTSESGILKFILSRRNLRREAEESDSEEHAITSPETQSRRQSERLDGSPSVLSEALL